MNDIDLIVMNIELAYDQLEYAIRDLQSPTLKDKLENIQSDLSAVIDRVEKDEARYRQSLQEARNRKKMVDDERSRTNYNHNTDGRMRGVYYAGQGDMGRGKR